MSRRMLVALLRRLHSYLHDLEAADEVASAGQRGVVLSSPLEWWQTPPLVERTTDGRPTIQFETTPAEVPYWTYPTQTG